MANSPILKGEPFSPEKTAQIAEQFFQDGFVHIPGVLTDGEVRALREKSDELFADPELMERTNPDLADVRYIQMGTHAESGETLPFVLRNTIELDSHIPGYASPRTDPESGRRRLSARTASFVDRMCYGTCPVFLLTRGMWTVQCIFLSPRRCRAMTRACGCL